MIRYLIFVLVFASVVLTGAGAFNYLVDPFLLYHHRGGGDQLMGRLDQFYNMRLYKPYHVRQKAPEALIIGTSRSGSIRPQHPQWRNLSTYNFATPGMTVYEMNHQVKHANAVRPLTKLLIGLDYHALVRANPQSRPGFEPWRLAEEPRDFASPRYIAQWLLDLQSFLFSFDMLGESLRALDPLPDAPRAYYADGTWEGVSKALVGRGGYIYVARSAVNSIEFTEFRLEANLPYYRDLLHFCYRNEIDTTLFFTPTHVFFVDLWFRITSRTDWRKTHRALVAINEEIAAEYGREPFDIMGFGDEAEVVPEPIYRARDIDRAWFKDGAHYGTRLGERLLDGLLDPSSDFGKPLTTANIDDYLTRIDELREKFMRSNRQDIEDLHSRIGHVPPLNE